MSVIFASNTIIDTDTSNSTIDVIIIAGQSNAVGQALVSSASMEYLAYLEEFEEVLFTYRHVRRTTQEILADGDWGPLRPYEVNESMKFGFELSAIREIKQSCSIKNLAVIKFASGGSELATEWDPNADVLYDDFIDYLSIRIDELQESYSKVNILGMLWFQGEKDRQSDENTINYGNNFVNFVTAIRTDLTAPNMSTVAGQIHSADSTNNTENTLILNDQLSNLANTNPLFATTISNDDLPLEDNVHYTGDGYMLLGIRMANAFIESGFCNNAIGINAKVFLQGPYNIDSNIMMDDLRRNLLIPIDEPYSNMAVFERNGDEATSMEVLAEDGFKAIVDWVLIELRSKEDPTIIVSSHAALLQKDGQVVDVDGESNLCFDLAFDEYYLAIRHRNHLAVMSASPILFTFENIIDFTNPQTATFGLNAQVNMGNAMALWAGNAIQDNQLIFQGNNNDSNGVFFQIQEDLSNGTNSTSFISNGYFLSDTNMDGKTIYQGSQNDPNSIFFNVLSHPQNNNFTTNFTIFEQLP